MKKHKGKIQTGIVIGIFSVIIIACLISIFLRLYAENKEKEEFRQLAEVVTEETTEATIEEIIKNQIYLKSVIVKMMLEINRPCLTQPVTNRIQYQNLFQ